MPDQVAFSELVLVNPPITASLPSSGSDVSFIEMQDVSNSGEWANHQTRRLSKVGPGYTAFQEGDVLFAKITPCMENGKGAQAVGLVNGIGFGSTEFHVIRTRQGISPRFIYHWCNSNVLRQAAEAQMIGSAGQQRVPEDFFLRFFVPFIGVDEQKAIAVILDAMDVTIRRTEVLIEKLQRVKAGLLHDLLTHGLDKNGELRDSLRHPEQFKDSSEGKIPNEWDLRTINDIATHVGSGITPTGGSNIYTSKGVLFIRSQNVTFNGLLLEDVAYIPRKIHQQMSGSEIFAQDTLLNITGASLGRCCVFSGSNGQANVNQHVCAIRLKEVDPGRSTFLAEYLASPWGQNQIFRFNAGSNREGLNYQQIRSITVPWPRNTEETDSISEKLLGARERFVEEKRIFDKLILLKKGLMQDLLTGQVCVPRNLIERYKPDGDGE